MREFTVGKNDAGKRLDKLLARLMPQLPPAMLYKGLRKDCVRVNGRHVRDGAYKTVCGDVLALYFKDEFFEKSAAPEHFMSLNPQLSVVYEDENILLCNKPQGLCVHEDENGSGANLIDYIKCYLWKKGEYLPEREQSFAPALCNRIDRNTSGLVIAAKNAEALRIMNEKIKSREVKKYYLCAVLGRMPKKSDTLTAYLRRDERKKQVYVTDEPRPGAKTAVTRYRVLAENGKYSLLEIGLETGRTHQIRAQLAHIGHPLVGDGKYGRGDENKAAGIFRQALCAYRLRFDFAGDSGVLEYLRGREFEVEKPPFCDLFK